jgi:hypothetical protein
MAAVVERICESINQHDLEALLEGIDSLAEARTFQSG